MFMFGMQLPMNQQVLRHTTMHLAEFFIVLLGGIYARNTKSIEVLSSSFINCSGSHAGAIYIAIGSITGANSHNIR